MAMLIVLYPEVGRIFTDISCQSPPDLAIYSLSTIFYICPTQKVEYSNMIAYFTPGLLELR